MFQIFNSDILIRTNDIRALYVYEDTICGTTDTQIDVYAIVYSVFPHKFSDAPIARNFPNIDAAKRYIQKTVGKISDDSPCLKIFPSGNAVDVYYVLSTYNLTRDDGWNIYADIGAEDNILLAEGNGNSNFNSALKEICNILNWRR